MMQTFVYEARPSRVVFGSGAAVQVGSEVERLAASRALVLGTPGRGERLAGAIAARLGTLSVGVYPKAVMHTPLEVTETALEAVRDCGADILVSVGGGSTTGLGKAIALRTGLPQIVLPTTYAGSEMTAILGETIAGRKKTQNNPKVLPQTVIYDVDLTLSLPAAVSVASGFNAIAHGVEALYARDGNPVISLMAGEGVAALARALPRIVANPADEAARHDALYGAFLCGACLGATTMALHHKLAHVLGGAFDLPHAETHTALLPHAVAYNAPAAPEAMARLASALDAPDPARGIYDLARRLGAQLALRDLGMPRAGIETAVEQTLANPYWNPRPIEAAAVRELLSNAWNGVSP